MLKLFRLTASAATVLLLIAERPVPVSAHAKYDHSDPADGATVTTSPSTLKVWFSEGVKSGRGSSLKVVDASNQQVDNNDSKVDTSDPDRKLMTVTLKPNLPAGFYTVQWNTVSADDGDSDDGKFSFTVKPAAAAPTSAPAAAPALPAAPISLPVAAPAAPPAAAPAAQPAAAAQPAPVQGPKALPKTGSGESSTLPLLLGIGGLLLVVGLFTRGRQSES